MAKGKRQVLYAWEWYERGRVASKDRLMPMPKQMRVMTSEEKDDWITRVRAMLPGCRVVEVGDGSIRLVYPYDDNTYDEWVPIKPPVIEAGT